MAGNTFYTRNASKASKASNSHRSQAERNNLPGLSYTQGHSIRDIFVPRGLMPVIGRNGYKTIYNERINDGTASNRTIYNTQDPRSNNYFVDSDAVYKSSFYISRNEIVDITVENYEDYIAGIIFPNGDVDLLSSLDGNVISDLVTHLVTNDKNFYEKISVPESLTFYKGFRGYGNFYFKFISGGNESTVVFPNGGITQVPNFGILTEVYGDNGDFQKSTPYTDLRKFNAIEWVQESGPPGMYPDVTPSPSYTGVLFNGIIEPFKIRTEIYDLDTFAKTDEKKPNSVSGILMNNITHTSVLSETLNAGSSHYEDIGNSNTGTALLEPQYITPESFHQDPFLEKDPFGNKYLDEEMLDIFSGAFLDTGLASDGIISQATGFITENYGRSSSINYRGRLR